MNRFERARLEVSSGAISRFEIPRKARDFCLGTSLAAWKGLFTRVQGDAHHEAVLFTWRM